jgi:hypothetical protein
VVGPDAVWDITGTSTFQKTMHYPCIEVFVTDIATFRGFRYEIEVANNAMQPKVLRKYGVRLSL